MIRPYPMASIQKRRFNPLTIGDCFLWLRSDLGVTLAGSKVGAWADQSGFGNDFVQAIDANRWVYTASDSNFNNNPSFACTTSRFMSSVATITAGIPNVSIFLVHRPGVVAGSGVILATGTGIGVGDMQLAYTRWSAYAFGAVGFDQAQQDTNDTINTRQHAAVTMPFGSLTTNNPANYKGGALAASTMTVNSGTNTNFGTKTWTLGALPAGAGAYVGALVEVFAFSKIVDTTMIARAYNEYTLPRYGVHGS